MRFSFKSTACLLAGCLTMGSAMALDNSVKPEVTTPLASSPKVALLIGNSYSFYNCGVHTYLRGMMRAGTPKENMKTRLLTISSGALSFHDVAYYLKPHEQDPYAIVEDGKLKKPMFDVVLLQGHSAAATSKKRLPYFEKYAVAHADTIRNAGSTPLLVMTWTKQDKPNDIRKLADNTIEIANKAKMMVVPVGLAFAEVRKAQSRDVHARQEPSVGRRQLSLWCCAVLHVVPSYSCRHQLSGRMRKTVGSRNGQIPA